MKRTLALILAFAMALTLASCSRGGANADTDAGTDADISSGMTEADAKRILEEFFTPTPTDNVVEDGFRYTSDFVGKSVRFFNVDIGNRNILKYMVDIDEKTEPVIACTIEGCTHDDVRCPAWNTSMELIIETDEGELIAYIIPEHNKAGTCKIGDYNIKLDDADKFIMLEYNITKGTLRCVATGLDENVFNLYYNGMIYGNPRDLEAVYDEDGMEMIWLKPVMQVMCIDAKTGKITSLTENGEKISALVCGVYNDRVYCIRVGGDLLSCSLDLTEYEVIANVDTDYMIPQSAHMNSDGLIAGDLLMYLKKDPNTPDPGRGMQESDFDLYEIDLSSGSFEPELVLRDVWQIRTDYYYNIYYIKYGDENQDYYLYDPVTRSSTLADESPVKSAHPTIGRPRYNYGHKKQH